MNWFSGKSLKGYLPVLTNDPDDDSGDLELGPSATNLEEPSLLGGCFDLTYKQRITGFALSAATGIFFLFLSTMFIAGIFVGLVSKFVMCYFFANIFLLTSTTFLVGIKEQCKNMMTKRRLPLSVIYIASMSFTMAATWRHQSILIILPLVIIQFISLIMYIVSYLPGGISALNFCGSRLGRLMFRFG